MSEETKGTGKGKFTKFASEHPIWGFIIAVGVIYCVFALFTQNCRPWEGASDKPAPAETDTAAAAAPAPKPESINFTSQFMDDFADFVDEKRGDKALSYFYATKNHQQMAAKDIEEYFAANETIAFYEKLKAANKDKKDVFGALCEYEGKFKEAMFDGDYERMYVMFPGNSLQDEIPYEIAAGTARPIRGNYVDAVNQWRGRLDGYTMTNYRRILFNSWWERVLRVAMKKALRHTKHGARIDGYSDAKIREIFANPQRYSVTWRFLFRHIDAFGVSIAPAKPKAIPAKSQYMPKQ